MMASNDSDNYVRCHQAVQLLCEHSIPCIQHVLAKWHQTVQQKCSPCTTPQVCPSKGKPKKGKGSCTACVAWGTELESAVYPSNSSGTLPWTNINPTRLHHDQLEAVKIFVLRLQQGDAYTDVGDFDSASLLMIMMKFKDFHHGDQVKYDVIKKVSDIRNHLAHIKVKTSLKLEDQETDDYFQALSDFITCLSSMHTQCFQGNSAQQILQTLQEIRSDLFDIDSCKKELARTYEEDKGKVSLFPFDVESMVDIDDIFVNLMMFDTSENDNEKQVLKSYDRLFCLKKGKSKDQPVFRVLVKGVAGSGKTTLAGKIAYDWAQGILGKASTNLTKFELLFFLKMKYCDQDSTLVDAVFEQLLPYDSKVSKRGLEKYLIENSEKMAFIFDGADEFGGKIKKSAQGNSICDIICNRMLCNSCAIVTTRPHTLNFVKEFSQYTHVAVTGFSVEGMLQFVSKFFQVPTFKNQHELHRYVSKKHVWKEYGYVDNSDPFRNEMSYEYESDSTNIGESSKDDSSSELDADDPSEESVKSFVKTIHLNPALMPLALIPVFLTMLCLLWKETQRLPDRFSTLYQEFIHYLTQRWLEKSEDECESEEIEINLLLQLGRVAIKCLLEDRLFFTGRELQDCNALQKACSVGIVIEERKRSRLHLVKHYCFLHKTFQEFCSAVYWASLVDSADDEFSHYLDLIHSDNVESFEYVLMFCCGLSNKAAGRIINHLVDIRSNKILQHGCCNFNLNEETSWLLGMRLLYESQSMCLVEAFTKWLECEEIEVNINFSIFGNKKRLTRLARLNYFIECFENHVSSFGRQGVFSKISAMIIHKQLDKLKTCTRDTSRIINTMLKYSKQAVTLKFSIPGDNDKANMIAAGLIKRMTTPFQMLQLEFFGLPQRSFLTRQNLSKYGNSIGYHLFFLGLSITCLKFKVCLIVINTILFTRSFDRSSLLYGLVGYRPPEMSKPRLTSVTGFQSNCTYSDESMKLFLAGATKLEKLAMHTLPLQQGPQDDIFIWKLLFQNLARAKSFRVRKLCIHNTDIGGHPFTVFLQSPVYCPKGKLMRNKKMSQSSLSGQFYWLPAALALDKLGIQTPVDFNAVVDFVEALKNTATDVTEINLTSANLEPSDIDLLVDGFQCCTALRSLDLSSNKIGDGESLSKLFPNLTGLTNLILRSTNISNKELAYFGGSLAGLKCLDLSSNHLVTFDNSLVGLESLNYLNLSGTSLVNFGSSLAGVKALQHLDLSGNSLGFGETHHLSEALQDLSDLRSLDISGNPIGDLGVLALCKAFEHIGSLQVLRLGDCGITSTGALLLAVSFKFLPNLMRLDLSNNTEIDTRGIIWLFESLRCLTQLISLHLDGITLLHSECCERLRNTFAKICDIRLLVGYRYKLEHIDDFGEKIYIMITYESFCFQQIRKVF